MEGKMLLQETHVTIKLKSNGNMNGKTNILLTRNSWGSTVFFPSGFEVTVNKVDMDTEGRMS